MTKGGGSAIVSKLPGWRNCERAIQKRIEGLIGAEKSFEKDKKGLDKTEEFWYDKRAV